MSEIVNESLQKIAKGTSIIFIGTIIGMLLGFVGRVLLVRYITPSEYGIYCMGLAILSICVMLSTLGLQSGATRQIAYYRGKSDISKVQSVIFSLIKIAVISSVLFSLLLFFTSDIISVKIFHDPELAIPLKIFSVSIPFSVMILVFTSIFRGFDRVDVKVYFNNILMSALLLLFLVMVILLGLPFLGVIYSCLASVMLTCLVFTIYTIKRAPVSTRPIKRNAFGINPMGKELLFLSLPLLISGVLGTIMGLTDTLMLGYFKTSEIVGLYNGAVPLARIIRLFLDSMVFIYVPVATGLYSKKLMTDMKRNYAVLTKWSLSLTLPIFLLLFLFPEVILDLIFGLDYTQAAIALRFLTFGFFVHTFVGPNGSSLIVMGRTRFLMFSSFVSLILNIILNIILIPMMGLNGAAISSAFSLTIANLLVSSKLYYISGIHPFTKNYLKPIILSISIALIMYLITRDFTLLGFWILPVFIVAFLFIYSISLILTKSFDHEDISLLLAIEKRTGINAEPIKKILRKFI